MRLRTLLATSFGLLTLGITVAGALAIYEVADARLAIRVGGEMAQVAGQIRTVLEANLDERLSDMQVLATLARTEARSVESRRRWVDALKRVYPVYAWIGFAGRDGTVDASTDGILEGANVGARPWFIAGTTAPFFGDVHEAVLLASKLPANPNGDPLRFIDTAAPVQDASGAIVGAVGAHLDWRWVAEATREALTSLKNRNPDIDVVVVGGSGEVLLGPPEVMAAGLPAGLAAEIATGRRPDGAHAIEAWPNGRSFLVGIAKAASRTDRPNLGWTILALRPTTSALAGSRQLSLEIMAAGTLFMIVAALIGWWLAGRIAKPLLALAEATGSLDAKAGNLPAPRGFAEVKTLTRTINRLVVGLAQRDAALAAANRDLEARVEARTAELALSNAALKAREEELRSARDTAEQASRAKADFLANMSHELRTPLTGMLGVHELLRDDPALAERQRRLFELAHEAGRSLLVIVNDVLDVSKIDAGQLAIERVGFGLRHLVESCRRIAAESAGGRDIAVLADVAPGLPDQVLGDPTRIRQILLNLATNAVKFTEAGEVRIRVEARAGRLRIAVTDSGIGIAQDTIPHLFERFSQADTSTTRRFGGTGLGLAICKRLVELMDGAIGVESRLGHGSTFWFELALEAAGAETGPAMTSSRPAPGTARSLLLVEDNELNREILSAVLTRQGHRVAIATNGDEAVALVRARRFDLVLMDVQMPGKDGLAATAEIRGFEAEDGRAPTPIVALTANAGPEEAERCRRAGMDAHVAKPVEWAVLRATIDRLCAASAAEPPPEAVHVPATVAVMDEAVLQTLAGYIGEERIGGLLRTFRIETERRLALLGQEETTLADLAGHAHVMVAMSGQLGFSELSAFCARLEAANQDGDLASVAELKRLADRALAAAAASRFAAA